MAYDAASGNTDRLFKHDYTFGIPADMVAPPRQPRPIAFVGGSVGQAARLMLVSDTEGALSAERCVPDGDVMAQGVPRLAGDTDAPPQTIDRSWSLKWTGPSQNPLAFVAIPFDELAPGPAGRMDALLSIRFDEPLPPDCQNRIHGSLETYDLATGETQAVVPMDRAFFSYRNF